MSVIKNFTGKKDEAWRSVRELAQRQAVLFEIGLEEAPELIQRISESSKEAFSRRNPAFSQSS
ncbi:hypothetical protein KZ483_14370 [Paenibacillus sp. sptzw28]|uniref:hypothetical protein n=1 Tax=Paenibacillus sp. sptzw28 TaxID=715179 RepID=UPI001C6E6F2A|nr:hypothetical protein [Paenibacillus sp. sptzw28]QYR19153.1 hypothetical protein KZ483_14370 [Paenibacillus sp. sptzw28]